MKYYERRERRQAAPSFIRGINKIPPFDISQSPPFPLAEGRPMGAGDAGRISGGLSLIVFDWSLPRPPSHTPSNIQTFTVKHYTPWRDKEAWLYTGSKRSMDYKDTKAEMSSLLVFNRVYRLEIQSVMLVGIFRQCVRGGVWGHISDR
jgi:hypothetical protein